MRNGLTRARGSSMAEISIRRCRRRLVTETMRTTWSASGPTFPSDPAGRCGGIQVVRGTSRRILHHLTIGHYEPTISPTSTSLVRGRIRMGRRWIVLQGYFNWDEERPGTDGRRDRPRARHVEPHLCVVDAPETKSTRCRPPETSLFHGPVDA